MRIININGPINAGKSTISKLLVQKLTNALFIEVDDLLSDEEQEILGLNLEQGWQERTDRLDNIIKQEKTKKTFDTIIFAYPITKNLYKQYKKWEDNDTDFISITLAPSLQICTKNRGNRALKVEEIKRIKQMYKENYHNPEYSNLIVDNSKQTPQQTLDEILCFLQSETIKIRNFKKEDLPQVLELCREVRQHHIDILDGYFTEQDDTLEQTFFLESIGNPKDISLVATRDNIVLGYILATKKESIHLVHSKIVHICNFGVKKNIRRNGIGKKLMDKLIEICKSEGIEQINLGVYNKNTSAYNFYEKYGFEPIEQKMSFDLTQSK